MFTIVTKKDIDKIAAVVWLLTLMHGALWTLIFAKFAGDEHFLRAYRTICEEFVQWNEVSEDIFGKEKRIAAADNTLSWLREAVDLRD